MPRDGGRGPSLTAPPARFEARTPHVHSDPALRRHVARDLEATRAEPPPSRPAVEGDDAARRRTPRTGRDWPTCCRDRLSARAGWRAIQLDRSSVGPSSPFVAVARRRTLPTSLSLRWPPCLQPFGAAVPRGRRVISARPRRRGGGFRLERPRGRARRDASVVRLARDAGGALRRRPTPCVVRDLSTRPRCRRWATSSRPRHARQPADGARRHPRRRGGALREASTGADPPRGRARLRGRPRRDLPPFRPGDSCARASSRRRRARVLPRRTAAIELGVIFAQSAAQPRLGRARLPRKTRRRRPHVGRVSALAKPPCEAAAAAAARRATTSTTSRSPTAAEDSGSRRGITTRRRRPRPPLTASPTDARSARARAGVLVRRRRLRPLSAPRSCRRRAGALADLLRQNPIGGRGAPGRRRGDPRQQRRQDPAPPSPSASASDDGERAKAACASGDRFGVGERSARCAASRMRPQTPAIRPPAAMAAASPFARAARRYARRDLLHHRRSSGSRASAYERSARADRRPPDAVAYCTFSR